MSLPPKQFVAYDDEDNPYQVLVRTTPASPGKPAEEDYVLAETGEVLTVLDNGIGIFRIESVDVMIVAANDF